MQDQLQIHGEGTIKKEKSEAERLNCKGVLQIKILYIQRFFHFCLRFSLVLLVITKGYGVQATTNEGQNAFVQRFALRKFHATDGQNARDHITSNRRFKRA